jgi:uncharacterized damage-inducible protein DinB
MKLTELNSHEYAPYFSNYISQVSQEFTMIEELEISLHRFIKFVQNIPIDKFDFRYEEGKWTIKEIIQHLIDCERIFAYRALRISRNDKTPLSSFDENSYVDNSNGNKRSLQDLLTELSVVRQATLSLYKSFTLEQLTIIGVASNYDLSVRAIGFIIIGHQNHHQIIFEKRYLD